MKVAIIGASGSIGTAVTRYLLDKTDYELVLFSHHAERLHYAPLEEPRIAHIDGDILQAQDINKALANCDMVVYLVHLMGNKAVGRDFEDAEVTAANNFVTAVNKHGIQRVIYIGGAGSNKDAPTKHLKSRNNTGDIIRVGVTQLIEYRTPLVVGPNAAGYEVIRSLVKRLPFVPVPSWGDATTQPISIHDVVLYIYAAMHTDTNDHEVIYIGGPEIMTYSQIFKRYAKFINKRCFIAVVPCIPQSLVAAIFRLFKNNPAAVTAADMIESSRHAYEANNNMPSFAQYVRPEPIENAFES